MRVGGGAPGRSESGKGLWVSDDLRGKARRGGLGSGGSDGGEEGRVGGYVDRVG